MMHQPSGGLGGTASDIKIQAEQMLYTKKKMAELIAQHTGQTVEQIERDSDRDRWFTAEEAKDYGFVDHVVTQRRPGHRLRRHRVSRRAPPTTLLTTAVHATRRRPARDEPAPRAGCTCRARATCCP